MSQVRATDIEVSEIMPYPTPQGIQLAAHLNIRQGEQSHKRWVSEGEVLKVGERAWKVVTVKTGPQAVVLESL